MKIFQPLWVNHDDKPIFSIDIHPDGSRVATGGQGNDCGRVAIWNMAPIKEEQQEKDPAVHKVLCQLDNHLGCVNCVRWSLDGSRLASAGDDKIIMIWRRSKGATTSFGCGFAKYTENWRCVHTLRGHEGDVLDLAWSPGDRWLASSSVDNTVLVWDMNTGTAPTVVSVLRGHTGLVKGVTWDPVGKYVASQSDDRSVKIWKTSDWTCDSTITEPFRECGGTTHILRLSWSPDGQYLVSAHAMNGGGPTAQIIEREGWKCDKDFVGHRRAVTCVRFHNSIMMRTGKKGAKPQQYCCLAVGSRDKSLSVWMTALQRPLVVIYDLFQDSVLDVSWSNDGYILMACSGDGTVVYIKFNEEDLGTPLSELEKNSLYQRMYGKGVNDMLNVSTDKDAIIENAELLNESSASVSQRPLFLSPEPKMKQDFSRIESRMAENSSLDSSRTIASSSAVQSFSPAKQAIHKQIETRTKDGKRRITPMFIPISQDVEMETATVTNNHSAPQIPSKSTSGIVAQQMTSSSPKINSTEKRDRDVLSSMDVRLAKMPPAKTNALPENDVQSSSISVAKTSIPPTNLNRTALIPFSGNRLDGNLPAGMTRIVGTKRLVVQNNFQKTPQPIHRLVCMQSDKPQESPLWQFVTGSVICSFNTSSQYAVLGCVDGTVHLLAIKYGGLVLPVITLSHAIVHSAFSVPEASEKQKQRELVGIVSELGEVRIWDLETKKIDLSVSCRDLMSSSSSSGQSQQQQNTTIFMFAITSNGTPFVVLGNGTSYCYARNLDSWLVLSGKDLLQQKSMIRCASSKLSLPKDLNRSPLASIQSTVLGMLPSSVMISAPPATEWEVLGQLSFVENQIRLCEAIQSADELKYWYSHLGYALACGDVSIELRLRQVLDDLLGPIYSSENVEERKLLGVPKLDLLELVLVQVNKQTKWHRLAMEYSDQLQELRGRGGGGGVKSTG